MSSGPAEPDTAAAETLSTDVATPAGRGIYANRTLNVRSLRAIGFDMDYTLIHYRVDEWERAAFEHALEWLAGQGWPVEHLSFDPDAYTLGLTFDLDLGNLVKATRFGHVVKVQHGTKTLDFDEQRTAYSETVIDLAEERFEFMNTLFELSRASLWCQLVDVHDSGRLPGVVSYADLWREIDRALSSVHQGGRLKAEIVAAPERFVVPDPKLVETLRDLRDAGKQLLLITNSDWAYTRQMMAYAVDPFVEEGTWRDLFDIVIVSANKPVFFEATPPIYRVVDEEESLLRPHFGPLVQGHVYFGGNARLVEESLGHAPAQMLYVGDHLFGDVHVTKDILRWRTALIAREIEDEVEAATAFAADEERLASLMEQKTDLERQIARRRLQRRKARSNKEASSRLQQEIDELVDQAAALDAEIGPLAQASAELNNETWGPLMRSGIDKSLFARQVERYADVYTSRVSNLWYETPYAYIRAARGSLPHDAR